MITKKTKLKSIQCFTVICMVLFSSVCFAQTLSNNTIPAPLIPKPVDYSYPINFADVNALDAVNRVRAFPLNQIEDAMKPRAEKGDVIAQWLLVDAYSRSGVWNEESTKWGFIATLMTLMDASVCSNPNDSKYALYRMNSLFGTSILNVRMHNDFLRSGLVSARDFILSKDWIENPPYYPSEICTPPTQQKGMKALPSTSKYKNLSDWDVLRLKVFNDFLLKGQIDSIPNAKDKNDNYDGPVWIN
jgi:hypothetical protein